MGEPLARLAHCLFRGVALRFLGPACAQVMQEADEMRWVAAVDTADGQ